MKYFKYLQQHQPLLVDKAQYYSDWQNYFDCRKKIYNVVDDKNLENNMVSEVNWLVRAKATSCEELGMDVHVGDICYIDYGQAYLNEIGYQHFGLIASIYQKKALVIPMTSNPIQYASAYDHLDNPYGKLNLMRIGKIGNMAKPSVLFLNDAKYINSARIIEKVAYLEPKSPLFRKIQQRMLKIIFNAEYSQH